MKHEQADGKKNLALSNKSWGLVIGSTSGYLVGGIPVMLWGALLGLLFGTILDELSSGR